MYQRELHCETCRGEMVFEVPPCADGHGADCPELACTGCGTALLIDAPGPLSRSDRPIPARAPGRTRINPRRPLAA